jgi:hypothetical protein
MNDLIFKQIVSVALKVDFGVKLDVIHTLYNIVTDYVPARSKFIENNTVAALVKVCKSIDSEQTLSVIGRILRELCQHTDGVRILISGSFILHFNILLIIARQRVLCPCY